MKRVEIKDFPLTANEFEELLKQEIGDQRAKKLGNIVQFKPINKWKRLNNIWGNENIEYEFSNDSIIIIAKEKNISNIEMKLESTATNKAS